MQDNNCNDMRKTEPCTALHDNLEKLKRISAFNYNWDGYGAEPLPEYLITSASKLIRNLRIQPEIFPTADGTIQLEYEKDNGDYLEIQISCNGRCEVFKRSGVNEEYFSVQDDSNSINALAEANHFEPDEKLYRAVYPDAVFWKHNGSLSSVAFLSKKGGCSVDRGFYREDVAVVLDMKRRQFKGSVATVTVQDCKDVNAETVYAPSTANEWHSEIHGSSEKEKLTAGQRKHLAEVAVIVCKDLGNTPKYVREIEHDREG